MDTDAKIAYLLELFPETDPTDLLNYLISNEYDVDLTIKLILDQDLSKPQNLSYPSAFDYLVVTFPDVDIEAIEAFLLARNIENLNEESASFDELAKEFMKQTDNSFPRSTSKRQNNLKMTLSDFSALLKTSQDRLISKTSSHFIYSNVFNYSCNQFNL